MPANTPPSRCEQCVPVRTSGHATNYTEYSHQTECPNHPAHQEGR